MKKVTLSVLMILALNATAMAGENKDAFSQAAYIASETANAAKNAKDDLVKTGKEKLESAKANARAKHVAAQEFANQNPIPVIGGETAGAAVSSALASSQTKLVGVQKELLKPLLGDLNYRLSNISAAKFLLRNDPDAIIFGLPEAEALKKQVNLKNIAIEKTESRVTYFKRLAGVLALDALTRTGYALAGKDVGVFAIDNAVSDGASYVSDLIQAKLIQKPEATRNLADQPANACEDDSATK